MPIYEGLRVQGVSGSPSSDHIGSSAAKLPQPEPNMQGKQGIQGRVNTGWGRGAKGCIRDAKLGG
jgi:hypothetical protein